MKQISTPRCTYQTPPFNTIYNETLTNVPLVNVTIPVEGNISPNLEIELAVRSEAVTASRIILTLNNSTSGYSASYIYRYSSTVGGTSTTAPATTHTGFYTPFGMRNDYNAVTRMSMNLMNGGYRTITGSMGYTDSASFHTLRYSGHWKNTIDEVTSLTFKSTCAVDYFSLLVRAR